jgi:hypothetical protein
LVTGILCIPLPSLRELNREPEFASDSAP